MCPSPDHFTFVPQLRIVIPTLLILSSGHVQWHVPPTFKPLRLPSIRGVVGGIRGSPSSAPRSSAMTWFRKNPRLNPSQYSEFPRHREVFRRGLSLGLRTAHISQKARLVTGTHRLDFTSTPRMLSPPDFLYFPLYLGGKGTRRFPFQKPTPDAQWSLKTKPPLPMN